MALRASLLSYSPYGSREVDPSELFYVLNRWVGACRQEIANLLALGASPDAVNADGWTALHVAAQRNLADVIPVLVTATNLDWFGSGPDQATPLIVAVAAGSLDAVEALLAAGADIRCCTPFGRTALGAALGLGHCAVALRLWQRAQQEPDCDAILAAALNAAGPDLDRPCVKGNTPLAGAAEQGYHQLFPLLLTPHNLNLPGVAARLTPLHLALKNNHIKAAEALLDAGAAVDVPDNIGRIPLAFAVQRSNTQLNVRLLQLMKQQQQQQEPVQQQQQQQQQLAPAAAGEAALMEPLITAAAWLCSHKKHAHSGARLFAAVMAAWGPKAARDLLQGLLKRLGTTTPHYLAEVLLVAWRQAQRGQLFTHHVLDRLQRLVLDPLASSSRSQQQEPISPADRALRLRLPLALLLNQAASSKGQGDQGPQKAAMLDTSLAADMGGLCLGASSSSNCSQADATAAAARRGSLREVAALLVAVPSAQLPAALLAAAHSAGAAGHTYLCNAALQQFAALDWQAAASTSEVAPLGALVRAAAAAAASGAGSTSSASGVAAPPGDQGSGGPVSGTGFCLYRALLDSWQAVPQMVGRELAAQVVAAAEAAAAQADGEP